MKTSEQHYHTIGESSRLSRIPAQTLRRWCDAGRIGCHRSPNGYRLIPASVVEELRQHGLQAFNPVDRESGEHAEIRPAKSSPSERLGLLGDPSPELRGLKERLEATKMQLELAEARRQLDEVNRQQAEQLRLRRREEEARAEAEEADRDRDDFEVQEAMRQAQVLESRSAWEKARTEWIKGQLQQAASKFRREALWFDLETVELDEALSDLKDALSEALVDSSHESIRSDVLTARDEVIRQLLRPFETRKEQDKIIAECRRELVRYLREQSSLGWLDLQGADVDFLAREIERPVMAVVEKEVRSKGLNEGQAKEYLHDVVNRRLSLV